MTHDILIVGAGIAGLSLARALTARGRTPVVLERARGVGGRCATRRVDGQPVDHGPAFLHGRTPRFLAEMSAAGGVDDMADWPQLREGTGVPCQPAAFDPHDTRRAPAAGVNALAKHLARELSARQRRGSDHPARLEQTGRHAAPHARHSGPAGVLAAVPGRAGRRLDTHAARPGGRAARPLGGGARSRAAPPLALRPCGGRNRSGEPSRGTLRRRPHARHSRGWPAPIRRGRRRVSFWPRARRTLDRPGAANVSHSRSFPCR